MFLRGIAVLLILTLSGLLSREGIGVDGIYRGRPSSRDKFRWVAQVRGPDSALLCHGALIADRWVLTLASCVKEAEAVVDVVVGDYDRSVEGDGEEVVAVSRSILHPSNSFLVNNAALLELSAPVNISSPSIEPISTLACKEDDASLRSSSKKCQIAGWGEMLDNGMWKLADVLQELKVLKEDDAICARLGLWQHEYYSCFRMGKFHSGPCMMDNGTPVVHNVKGHRVLVGLMYGSFSVDGCVGGVKIVSKASCLKEWIQEFVPNIV